MAKYKVEFNKFKKGQSFYQRSFSLESLELLLLTCSKYEVRKNKKKTGEITFSFYQGDLNTFAVAKNIPLWILKRFAPEKEWT